MHDHDHEHKGGFLNGLILGLLIGAGLVFLFGTNKGKKVLQMLLDQVEENTELSELLEMPDADEEFMGVEEEPSYAEEAQGKESDEKVSSVREIKPQRSIARVKRFFKGAPKKLVS